jgi:hypothetical protein
VVNREVKVQEECATGLRCPPAVPRRHRTTSRTLPEPLDQTGEAGLQEALDRIYPRTGLVRKPMGGPLSNRHAQWYYPPRQTGSHK